MGPGSPAAGNPSVGALASGTQAKGKRVAHEAPKLLGFPLPFCLSQLLLHDLGVPLLGGQSPRSSVLSLHRAALPFLILLVDKLLLVTSRHGDCSDSALLYMITFQLSDPYSCSPPRFSSLPATTHLTTVTILPSPVKLPPSVQFRRSVVSDSLPPHGLQLGRLPSPSPTPGVSSSSCPLSQ